MSQKQTIRVATFNIHNAHGSQRRSVGRLLRESGARVICLQECSQSAVDALRGMLGEGWSSALASTDWGVSNAIMSDLEFSEKIVMRLPAEAAETRAAVLATFILASGQALRVCATHLDHLTVEARLEQWKRLREALPRDAIFCGDLNALRRADYTESEWGLIASVRRRSDWEAPVSTLTDAIHADGWRLAGASSAHGTCRYHTRIDYIWLGPRAPGRFVPGSYRVIPAIAPRISDHELVVVDVVLD